MKEQQLQQDWQFWSIFLAILSLGLVQAISYYAFFTIRFGISLEYVFITSLIALLLLLIRKPATASTAKIVLTLSIISASLTSILGIWENQTFPNAVFSTFHLNIPSLLQLSLFILSMYAIILLTSLAHEYKKSLFQLPLLFFAAVILIYICNVRAFEQIGIEDNLIECVATLALFGASAFLVRAVQKPFLTITNGLLVALSIAFFVLGAEEISWGQRLFNTQLPSYFQENNVQQETTIHNLRGVHDLMYALYAFIGLAAILAPYFKTKFPKQLRLFVPNKHIAIYFFFLSTYGWIRIFYGPLYFKTWEEAVEIIFSIGVFVYSLEILALRTDVPIITHNVKKITNQS